jgi:hypothetical protein
MFQIRHESGSDYEVWASQLFGKFKWQFIKSFPTMDEARAYVRDWVALGEKDTRTSAEIIASFGKSC